MTPVSQDKLDEIIEILNKRGAVKPCPRCGHKEFTLANAYFNQILQDNLKKIVIGGPTVPCAVVICQNCGFMSQHSLGYLGLLDEEMPK
jgi:predicted nucleic-acid-binding Zn-ribbon protein